MESWGEVKSLPSVGGRKKNWEGGRGRGRGKNLSEVDFIFRYGITSFITSSLARDSLPEKRSSDTNWGCF